MAIYSTGSYDASRTNNSSRSARIYKDLNLIFSPHPNTKDVTKKTDIEVHQTKCKESHSNKTLRKTFSSRDWFERN